MRQFREDGETQLAGAVGRPRGMSNRFRPGPQPWRKRLHELDVEALGDGLRSLLRYANGEGDSLGIGARELSEAVLVAHQASTARAALARGKGVTARDLAALAGVTPTRIRQLVSAGTLKREAGLVTAESAISWLGLRSPKSPIKAHRFEITPSWWKNGPIPHKNKVLGELLSLFHERMPPQARLYPGNTDILFTIPRQAGVDVSTAERTYTEFLEWLESRDPAA